LVDLAGGKPMQEQEPGGQFTVGKGIAFGVIGGAILAVLVSAFTGDASIWVWAIPVGVAVGVAIGAGLSQRE
jgi:uncharacterized membrane protein YoaK (UPF0700 family)